MRTAELTIPFNVNFTPKDLKFPKYMLPNTLGSAEAEEIIARYITICQEDDKWVGINLSDFINTIKADFKNIKEVSKDTWTFVLLDCGKNDQSNFCKIGFESLNKDKYINWRKRNGETYLFPTEKLFYVIKKFIKHKTKTSKHTNSGLY